MTARPPDWPAGVWGHLDALSAAELLTAARVEELSFGTLWVPRRSVASPSPCSACWPAGPPSMLLGTSIVSIWGHDPQTTRMAAGTLRRRPADGSCWGLASPTRTLHSGCEATPSTDR